jgi:hypothetical protein
MGSHRVAQKPPGLRDCTPRPMHAPELPGRCSANSTLPGAIIQSAALSPFIPRVNCGGRNLTLETKPTAEILPLVMNKIVALKRPYLHYSARVA